jgi:hypothetical protein
VTRLRCAVVLAVLVAATTGGATWAREPAHGRACVQRAFPAGTAPVSVPLRCFRTLAGAVTYATGGTVAFAAGTPRAAVLSRLASADTAHPDNDQGAMTVIGIDHDTDLVDTDLVWQVAHAAGCADGTAYYAQAMPSGWDNRVDAATAFTGCDRWDHYAGTGYGGAVHACTCLAMGALADATSSEKWRSSLPVSSGPVGRKCGFNSTTDLTREAGWQTGDLNAGPLVTGESGTLRCRIVVNANTHDSTNVRAEWTVDAVGGVVPAAASTLRYQATAADDIELCTAWLGAGGTLYWQSGDTASADLGHWSTSSSTSCNTACCMDESNVECSLWKAVDRRLGTNVAEIWQDCEPYEEFPLPI